MSTFTVELSAADDRALAFANSMANAALPSEDVPLTDSQYLRRLLRGWLQSYKKENGRITSSLILSRVPRGKWAAFFDAQDAEIVAFREMLLDQPSVGKFSDEVNAGLTACITSGVLTRNQADALVA